MLCGFCLILLIYFKTKSLKMRIYIYKIYVTVSVAITTLITRNCRLNYNFTELPASPIMASVIMHDIVHVFGVTRRRLGLLLLCSSLLFSVGLVSRICIGSPVHLARISIPRDLISPPCFSFICVRKTLEK